MASFREDLVALAPRLRRFAIALTGSVDDAEDVVQSAMERALRHESNWAEHSRLDSWMYRIIQNLWIDELRTKRRRNVPLDAVAELAADDGRDVIAAHVDLDTARRALAALPPDQRTVLCLVVVDGMTYQQAASVLEIPVGTVMSRLSRARAAMATRVAGHPMRTTRSLP